MLCSARLKVHQDIMKLLHKATDRPLQSLCLHSRVQDTCLSFLYFVFVCPSFPLLNKVIFTLTMSPISASFTFLIHFGIVALIPTEFPSFFNVVCIPSILYLIFAFSIVGFTMILSPPCFF